MGIPSVTDTDNKKLIHNLIIYLAISSCFSIFLLFVLIFILLLFRLSNYGMKISRQL